MKNPPLDGIFEVHNHLFWRQSNNEKLITLIYTKPLRK